MSDSLPDSEAPDQFVTAQTVTGGDGSQSIIPTTLSTIERLLSDPNLDIDRAERLFAFQERLMARQAEIDFNIAKGRILKRLAHIKIVKNKSVLYQIKDGPRKDQYQEAFKYATLEEIDKHLRPLLADEDMDLSYSEEAREGGGMLCRGRLKHLPGGHFEDSTMPAPLDTSGGKSNVQGVGSTNSYLRRYIACNMFNIVVIGDDDDGNGGFVSDTQAKAILGLMQKAQVGGRFLKLMNARPIEETGSPEGSVLTIPAAKYREAVATLEEQIAKRKAAS